MKFKLDKSAQNLSPTHIAKQLEDQLFGFEHYQQQRKLGLYKSDWLEESIDFQDYNKLADDGDFNARLTLGFIYYKGFHNNNRKPNFEKSSHYYSLACQSYIIWANAFYQRFDLKKGITLEPRLIIESMTVLTSNKATIMLPPEFGITHYSNQCEEGVFCSDWIEDGASFQEYKNSADNGNLAAQLNLGFIYKTGSHSKGPKLSEAKKYYQLAALQLGVDGYENNIFAFLSPKIPHPNLLNLYGFLHANNEKQYSKAWTFYKLAADLEHSGAPKSLLNLHKENKAFFENSVQEERYYRMSLTERVLFTKGIKEEKAQNYKLAKFYYKAAGDMGRDNLIALNASLEMQLVISVMQNNVKAFTKLLFEEVPIPQGRPLLHKAIQRNNFTIASLLIFYGVNINTLLHEQTARELNPFCFDKAWAKRNDYYVEIFMLICTLYIELPKELACHIFLNLYSFTSNISANEYKDVTKAAEYNITVKAIGSEYTSNKKMNFKENLPLEGHIEAALLGDKVMLKTLQKLDYITDTYQLGNSATRAFKIAFNALDRSVLALALIAKEIKRLKSTFLGISLKNSSSEITALRELKDIIESHPKDLALEMTLWETKYQPIFVNKKNAFEEIKEVLGMKPSEEVNTFVLL